MSSTSIESEPNNVLTIKTVQIAPFRTLMTALKDILLETNITFKKDGIRIINMDKSHTMLAHLFLGAENFEHYECNKEKIIIGVNMFHLFKFNPSFVVTLKLLHTKTLNSTKPFYLQGKTIMYINCQRCNCKVKSFSPMRKWCFDCRKIISLEQAKERKLSLLQ